MYEPGAIIYICKRDDKVSDVWKGMVKHNILSVPVLQKTEHLYYGVIDLHDIVYHLTKHFEGKDGLDTEGFWAQVNEKDAFGDATVNDIMKYDPFSE